VRPWDDVAVSRASLEKKPTEVASMFDGIAARYDLVNDLVSLGQDRRWRRLTVEAVAATPGEKVLDLAAGTGTSSEPFAADGALVVPSDFSLGMLRVVRPGGRVVICEFSHPTWAPFRTVYMEYLMRALPVVAGAVTRDKGSYEYLAESIRAWPTQPELARRMIGAGWDQVAYRNLSAGIVALHRAVRPAA